jgi:hypothetical protein
VLNRRAFTLYRHYRKALTDRERERLIAPEQPVPVSEATALVFGMGRIGTSAYDSVRERLGDKALVAFDVDGEVVAEQTAAGRRVFEESATDADFWQRLHIDRDQVQLIVLAMHSHEENKAAVEQLRMEGFKGFVAATAHFDDEVAELQALGVNQVHHLAKGAGPALAESALAAVDGGDIQGYSRLNN